LHIASFFRVVFRGQEPASRLGEPEAFFYHGLIAVELQMLQNQCGDFAIISFSIQFFCPVLLGDIRLPDCQEIAPGFKLAIFSDAAQPFLRPIKEEDAGRWHFT
jgi:hypothetical protein